MAIPISHNWQKGLWRLTHCMRTLALPESLQAQTLPRANASAKHKKLYKEYCEYLEEALFIAEEWWVNSLEVKTDEGMSAADALNELYDEAVAGPAARREVVWTVRTFWLRCAELNRTLPLAQRVSPECLLLQWLFDDGLDEPGRVLAGMPYWPIGLDAEGNWC